MNNLVEDRNTNSNSLNLVNQTVSAYSVSDRLPKFWKQDPEIWFLQVEAIFSSARITTSKRKFEDTIAKLDYDVLKQVSDLVRTPSDQPYEELRKRLIAVYSQSENERITKLLEEKQLGDQKPSHLLREMQILAGTSITNELLKNLWLRGLPQRMRDILIALDQNDLDKLANVADRLLETYGNTSTTVYQVSKPSHVSSEIKLTEMVQKLTAEVEALRLQRSRDRSFSRNRSTSRSKSRSQIKSDNGQQLCFYHSRFKTKARKCIQPCSWIQKSEN